MNSLMYKVPLFIMIFVLNINLYAKDNSFALQLQRAKEFDNIIKNINTIFELSQSYILMNGDFNITRNKIDTKYLLSSNYYDTLSNNDLSFKVNSSNTSMIFSNIIDTNNRLLNNNMIKQMLIKNPNLYNNAQVNENDYNITIPFGYEVRVFDKKMKMITDIYENANISMKITSNITSCDQNSTIIYKPNGDGSFFIYSCDMSNQAKFLGNKLDISLYRANFENLTNIQLPIGTVAYVGNSTTNSVNEYIYTGNTTGNINQNWTRVIR